ncbi:MULTISPECIES: RHS repeat domain-containing protein [unclassified Butyricimonas]|uniref:RHS repeat domain-containing protein n=1 Tax=unclassified Butyricimonas TaxID=2637652 RepID=UPI000C07C18A|nr:MULTISPECIES: DUF6443 domain-containing protein [unclassified Butyricimonas]
MKNRNNIYCGIALFVIAFLFFPLEKKCYAQGIASFTQSVKRIEQTGGNLDVTVAVKDAPKGFKLKITDWKRKAKVNNILFDYVYSNKSGINDLEVRNGNQIRIRVPALSFFRQAEWIYEIETNAGKLRISCVQMGKLDVPDGGCVIWGGHEMGEESKKYVYLDFVVSPGYQAKLYGGYHSGYQLPSGCVRVWGEWSKEDGKVVVTPLNKSPNVPKFSYMVDRDISLCFAVMKGNEVVACSNPVTFILSSSGDGTIEKEYASVSLLPSDTVVAYGGQVHLVPTRRFPGVTDAEYTWERRDVGSDIWVKFASGNKDHVWVQNVKLDGYYRRKMKPYNGSITYVTDTVLIEVDSPEGGMISVEEEYCSRGESVAIKSEREPRYPVEGYSWEKRVRGTENWVTLPGQTGEKCVLTSVAGNADYRRRCETARGCFYSNEVFVYSDIINKVEKTVLLDPTTTCSAAREIKDVVYLDGLGREILSIQESASPAGGDIITPKRYGVHGREERSYLPYARVGNNGPYDFDKFAPANWLQVEVAEREYVYTETRYDNSPLNRVVKQTGPGKAWHAGAGKGVSTEYKFNEANQVKCWSVDASGQLVGGDVFYPSGVLSRQVMTDEDGLGREEFTDDEGRAVLAVVASDGERLETYKVHDDRGLVRYVLSPEASKRVGRTATRETECVALYGYYYEYDALGRLVLKQLPGCAPVYMVYDKRDRLVMSQDGKQRAENANKWSYSLYDRKNRVVETGEVVLSTATTHASLQTLASSSLDYTPAGTRAALQYTLYDTYTSSADVPVKSFVATSGYTSSYHPLVAGLVTSVKTCVLGTDTWLTVTTYYDDRCRVIQTVSDNLQGGVSRVDMKYDFVGNVVKQRESHTTGERTDVLESEHVYDDRGRLLSSTVNLNNSSPATVTYTYDAVGRLVKKKHGAVEEMRSYNSRGWLTCKESVPFKMKLRYENPEGGAVARWNGTISEWVWQQGTSAALMYGFTYDGVNRLTGMMQKQKSGSTWSTLTGSYLEKGITYDRNGNIKTLQRTANGNVIDNLVYSYTGNQLTGLTENVSGTPAGDVYVRGNSASGTYSYDRNGNMINDSRRALNLSYNVLNLLGEVKSGSTLQARYSYLADGTKLRVRDGSGNGFDYLGSLTYKSGSAGLQLESASFGDGVILSGTSGQDVHYFLTDHLGSVRVIVDGSGKVLERNDYYAFGARHARSDYPQQAVNRLKYNGKEEQVTGGLGYLDYGWRMLDKGLGRWFGVDPMAEKYDSWSPYNYALNIPVRFIDPNGMWLGDPPGFLKGWNQRVEESNNNFWRWLDTRSSKPSLLFKDLGDIAGGILNFLSDVTFISTFVTGQNKTADALGDAIHTVARMPSMSSEELGSFTASSVLFLGEFAASRKLPIGKMSTLKKVGGVTKNVDNIAFGLGDDLFSFAKNKGFKTYRDFSIGFQKDKILSMINDSNNKLHFNLTGFSKYRFSKYNPTQPVTYNNITNWELHTILNNPDALQRTIFYRYSNGNYNVVPNPFK